MDTPFITNQEIARVLFQIGALLETMEGNPFRVRAYRRAALGVLFLPRPLVDYVASHQEVPVSGLGDRLRQRLYDLVNTGHIDTHAALLDEIGEPMATLLGIEGVGPKTAIRLISELGVGSLEDLRDAAYSGRIQELRGFGAKRQEELGRRAAERLAVAA